MSVNGEAGIGFTDEEGIPFVGAGPGDSDLLTVAGWKPVEGVNLVVYAGSLANSKLLDEFCADIEQVNGTSKDLEELIPLVADAYESGRTVARFHSGDLVVYRAALEQMDALVEAGVPSYLVPGVTSAFVAGVALRIWSTLNEVLNHIVFTRPRGWTFSAEEDHINDFVGFGDTTAYIYLGTHAVSEMMDRLLDEGHDPDTPVVVIYYVSWPDEDVIESTIETIGERVEDAGYRASAFVVTGGAVNGLMYERSFLYGDWARGGNAPNDGPDTETQGPDNE